MRLDVFRNIASYFEAGDCLVMNDTQVIRARLHGRKPTGARVEIFLLREIEAGLWTALVKPSARLKPGTRVHLREGIAATVGEILSEGRRKVYFDTPDVLRILEQVGEIPLPPYIVRKHPDDADLMRYQTVYARSPGAVAAPTAGLHFTTETLESLSRARIRRATITLHVGYATFRPIVAGDLENHQVEAEDFECSAETARLLNRVRAHGRRIVAVGTTSARVLETQFRGGAYHAGAGRTDLYIYPPYTFKGVDALQTNFHLPRSSLLALVCAFAGRDLIFEAYQFAIREGLRFYSYGDTMLIL
jgi:S-adenosylmethionine:tRNA ribosyltransferase-isomerase